MLLLTGFQRSRSDRNCFQPACRPHADTAAAGKLVCLQGSFMAALSHKGLRLPGPARRETRPVMGPD